MAFTNHIRLAFMFLRRLVDVFVVMPAIFIAVALFATGFEGGNPIRSVVAGVYQWADDSLRNAPDGAVLVESGAAVETLNDVVLVASARAQDRQYKPIPIKQAIDQSTDALTQIYWICVIVGIGLMLFFLPPSQLFGFSLQRETKRNSAESEIKP